MAAVSTQGPTWSHRRTYLAQNAGQGRGLALVQGGSGDSYAATAASADVVCIGIQEEASVNAGDPIAVIQGGDAVGIAGAAVAAGQFVKTNAAGQLIPSATTGDQVVGQALSSAASAGDEFLLAVRPFTL
jgi:hypothetical protein